MKTISSSSPRFHRFAPAAFLVAFLVGFSPSILFSQDSDAETVFDMDPFSVVAESDRGYRATAGVHATGFKIPLFQTPLNISILTDDFLEDTQITNLGEATAYMSGVNADLETHDGPKFYVRGFRANWVNRNGIQRYAVNGSDNIERFEVLKGPMAVFYGRVSPGGVINYVTKRASFTEAKSLKLSYGSYDYRRAEIELQGPLYKDKIAYRINASYLDKNDWRDFEYERRSFFYGGILWQPTSQLTIHAEWEKSDSKSNNAHGIGWGNGDWLNDYADPINNAPDLFAYARENPDNIGAYRAVASAETDEEAAEILQTRWLRRGSDKGANSRWMDAVEAVRGYRPNSRSGLLPEATPYGWKFNVGGPGNYSRFVLAARGIDARWVINDNLTLRLNGVTDKSHREHIWNVSGDSPRGDGKFIPQTDAPGLYNETYQISSRLLWNFYLLGFDNTFVFNASRFADEWRPNGRERDDTYEGVPSEWDPFNDPYFDIGPSFFRDPGVSNSGSNSWRDAMGFSHTIRAFDETLTVLWGLRNEKIKQENPFAEGSEPNRWDNTTPMGGVTWEFLPGFTVYGSYSESFDTNASSALIRPLSNATEAEKNAPLPASEGKGWDVGLKSAWLDYTLSGSLAIFEVRNTNKTTVPDIERTQNDPRNNDEDNQNDVMWSKLVGLDVSRGVELDLTWTPNDNYQAQLAFAYMYDAKNGDTGERLPNSPKTEVGFWNIYRFSDGSLEGFSVGAGFRYKERFETAWENHFIPSYLVTDFLIRYKTDVYGNPTTFSLNVKNLTDERYIISAPNRPGENRQFVLTADMDF